MALDPTISEAAFKKSVKKFFVDELITGDGLYVDFDTQFKRPQTAGGSPITSWIVFDMKPPVIRNNVANGLVQAYLFSIEDNVRDKITTLRDTLVELLQDTGKVDYIKRVPLYAVASWTVAQQMMVQVGEESDDDMAPDGSWFRVVNIHFTFGAK